MLRKSVASWPTFIVVLAGCFAQTQVTSESWAKDTEIELQRFCAIVEGPLGRIVEISASPQLKPSVMVERGSEVQSVKAGCYLRGNDVVRAGEGTSVTVIQTDGRTVIGDFNHRLLMPVVLDIGLTNRIWAAVHEWAGGDLSEARNRLRTSVAATRAGDESPILIRGLFEVDAQRIGGERNFEVQWDGGTFPFQIDLEGPRGTSLRPIRQSASSERAIRLDFRSRPTGEYRLTITSSSGKVRRFLNFLVVPAKEVPMAPTLEQINDQRTRDLIQAIWLLTKGPSQWRLDALSRLALLAKDQRDPIARSILETPLEN
jgi:hypothetical protein